MPSVQTLWLPAPTGGEAPSLPPDQLKDTVARELRNWLTHHPGRITPRGSIGGPSYAVPAGTITRADGGQILSLGVADDQITASFRQPSAAPLVDPWRAPVNRPVAAASMATGSDDGGSLNVDTGVFTPIGAVAQLSIQGPSICRVDQALYTATFGGVATLVNGHYDTLNAVRKIQLGGGGAVLTSGPRFVRAVFSHYGRVFAAGARRPGGADYDTSQVFYTIPGGSTLLTDVATDWQDPVTGELNRISIGAANDGDFVVGFGRAAGHLLIFKRDSVWILYGTSPSNFTLRQLRTQSGCVDERSICVADEGTYFASQLGYELFDGNRFRLLSEPVSDEWLPISNAGVAAATVNHAFIKASPLPNGYLYLALGTDSHVSGAGDGVERAWLLHSSSASWITVRTNIAGLGFGVGGYPNQFIKTRGTVTAWAGTGGWARADDMTYGAKAADGVRDGGLAGAAFDVDLIWRTRLANLAGPWTSVQLHSIASDFHQHYVDATPGPPAWATVEGKDGFGAVIVPAFALDGYPSPGPDRARPTRDKKHESARGDLSLRLVGASGATDATRSARIDLHGLGIAFVAGRERHIA